MRAFYPARMLMQQRLRPLGAPRMDSQYPRQQAIRDILTNEEIHSQPELLVRLAQRGIKVTQSSISRDLRQLRVAKVDGRYVLPEALAESVSKQARTSESDGMVDPPVAMESSSAVETLRGLVLEMKAAGPHLLVVNTPVGAAQIVGVSLDGAGWHEIVGTLAGDDTVFIATPSQRAQIRLRRRLEVLMSPRP